MGRAWRPRCQAQDSRHDWGCARLCGSVPAVPAAPAVPTAGPAGPWEYSVQSRAAQRADSALSYLPLGRGLEIVDVGHGWDLPSTPSAVHSCATVPVGPPKLSCSVRGTQAPASPSKLRPGNRRANCRVERSSGRLHQFTCPFYLADHSQRGGGRRAPWPARRLRQYLSSCSAQRARGSFT